MVFKKKYEDYYMAKLWKPYEEIPKSEVKAIIQNYGYKPFRHSKELPRVVYDETPMSLVPRRKHQFRGDKTIQLAIFENTLYFRILGKHINKINREDLESFKSEVEKFVNSEVVFRTDKRFLRLRLGKGFEIFKKIEHNLIHRIIAVTKNRVYKHKVDYKTSLALTCRAFNLQLREV